MKDLKRCKEPRRESGCKACGGMLPKGNTVIAYTARKLGYCRYCYLSNYPKRRRSRRFIYRQGMVKTLNWTDLRLMERAGFNPEVWSPDFRREMEEYWRARMRGEL